MITTSEIVSVEPEFLSDRSRSSPLFAVGEFSFFFFLNTVQVQAEEATEGDAIREIFYERKTRVHLQEVEFVGGKKQLLCLFIHATHMFDKMSQWILINKSITRSPSSTDHCAGNHLSHYLIATSPLSFPLGCDS
ncbi:hypothetical protein P8452_52523 [Trifolium repens]|nr:hypothetical protein P8452_52523 [Trifolium repens]